MAPFWNRTRFKGKDGGDHSLTTNHVLLQFVPFSAFFLDGYGHVAEMLAGRAYEAKNKALFIRKVKHSSTIAAVTALILSISIYALGDIFIPLLSKDAQIQSSASNLVFYAAECNSYGLSRISDIGHAVDESLSQCRLVNRLYSFCRSPAP